MITNAATGNPARHAPSSTSRRTPPPRARASPTANDAGRRAHRRSPTTSCTRPIPGADRRRRRRLHRPGVCSSELFAQDLPRRSTTASWRRPSGPARLAALVTPVRAAGVGRRSPAGTWSRTQDRIIPPEAERAMAERAGAPGRGGRQLPRRDDEPPPSRHEGHPGGRSLTGTTPVHDTGRPLGRSAGVSVPARRRRPQVDATGSSRPKGPGAETVILVRRDDMRGLRSCAVTVTGSPQPSWVHRRRVGRGVVAVGPLEQGEQRGHELLPPAVVRTYSERRRRPGSW